MEKIYMPYWKKNPEILCILGKVVDKNIAVKHNFECMCIFLVSQGLSKSRFYLIILSSVTLEPLFEGQNGLISNKT